MKGKIPEKMLAAALDSLPVELTLTDAGDRIVAWTEPTTKIFQRKDEILGTDVRKCHSEKSQAKVEKLLRDLKLGKRDKALTIIDCKGPDGKPGKVIVEYSAVRSPDGKYLGCLETCRYADKK
jgi:DUF438 domain-containing protein